MKQSGAGHPNPIPPTLGHQELTVKWDEQWGAGHPIPTHPPFVFRSWELSEMSNEEHDTTPPPHPPLVIMSWQSSEMNNDHHDTPPPPHSPLVIMSWQLSEMSNEEQDIPPPTPSTLGHHELTVKWDEQWGAGHPNPTPPLPPLVIRSWQLSEMNIEEDDNPTTTLPPFVIRSSELSKMSKEGSMTSPPPPYPFHPHHKVYLGMEQVSHVHLDETWSRSKHHISLLIVLLNV